MFLLVPVLKVLFDAVVHYMSSFSVAFATAYKAVCYVTDRPLCVSVYENTGKSSQTCIWRVAWQTDRLSVIGQRAVK